MSNFPQCNQFSGMYFNPCQPIKVPFKTTYSHNGIFRTEHYIGGGCRTIPKAFVPSTNNVPDNGPMLTGCGGAEVPYSIGCSCGKCRSNGCNSGFASMNIESSSSTECLDFPNYIFNHPRL